MKMVQLSLEWKNTLRRAPAISRYVIANSGCMNLGGGSLPNRSSEISFCFSIKECTFKSTGSRSSFGSPIYMIFWKNIEIMFTLGTNLAESHIQDGRGRERWSSLLSDGY